MKNVRTAYCVLVWYSGGGREGPHHPGASTSTECNYFFFVFSCFGLAKSVRMSYESFLVVLCPREGGWGLGKVFVRLCRILFISVSLCLKLSHSGSLFSYILAFSLTSCCVVLHFVVFRQ